MKVSCRFTWWGNTEGRGCEGQGHCKHHSSPSCCACCAQPAACTHLQLIEADGAIPIYRLAVGPACCSCCLPVTTCTCTRQQKSA
jgi:hypothetical protein